MDQERHFRPQAAAKELSGQYEEILVDEYQDSNLVQETLIQSISRERLGQPNVFMVGDVKQSIYCSVWQGQSYLWKNMILTAGKKAVIR